MLRLVFLDAPFVGRVCQLSAERSTVGRDASNTLVIADPSVSSRHAEILLWGTEVIVRDLGSRNGTFVNGTRLHEQQAPADNGALVEFGTVRSRLELDVPTDSGTVTDFTAAHAFVRYAATVPGQVAGPKPDDTPSDAAAVPKLPGPVVDPRWLRRALWIMLLGTAVLALFSWLRIQ
jgi:S-DNA-T family DNA segregation ATPase FtsK/SpoIIIE